MKHPRHFWLDAEAMEISWGKTMRSKKCKTEKLCGIIAAPTIPDAKELFEEIDEDGSGSLDASEVAQLYMQARGEKLGKAQLQAAMAEMDTDRSGVVELPEFERWWSVNGGDLEQHRANAFTFVFAGGLEVLVVAALPRSKQRWVEGCEALLATAAPPPVDLRGQLTIYYASGYMKHPRFFWLNSETRQISWGKTMRAKKCKTERLAGVRDGVVGIPDAKALFEDMDEDGSGSLDASEVAQLYMKAKAEKLSKARLQAAMAEMDTDRSGVVELPEFERWWRLNGGDLEEHRANALTFVCEGGLEVLAVCPTRVAKQRWLAGCKSLGWLLA